MVFENRRKRLIAPVHPGEMLREDFLPDYDLSVKALADALDVSRQTVNELIREKRSVSPEMAIRLGRLFGNSPQFWLSAQLEVDLWDASIKLKNKIDRIMPLRTA